MDLKQYFFDAPLSKKDFAEQIGVNVSMIYHIMSKARKPSAELAAKIEKVTEGLVTKEELLFPDESPPKRWRFNEGKMQESLEDHEERISRLEEFFEDEFPPSK